MGNVYGNTQRHGRYVRGSEGSKGIPLIKRLRIDGEPILEAASDSQHGSSLAQFVCLCAATTPPYLLDAHTQAPVPVHPSPRFKPKYLSHTIPKRQTKPILVQGKLIAKVFAQSAHDEEVEIEIDKD
ncbi:hypothetical protein CBL_00569 [Carabus blaptoides fortunei]